ncbi:MAG: hypothetical protein D6675_07305 [Gemmatimonadetes bacterium]|nr:MAG: hypothetical protein D6675_07305 [Gemmatimonadota bacterium]
MNKLLMVLVLLIPCTSLAIEVGGHLTEDTVWSPGNNPYIVVNDLYIDPHVTLTIQAGTIIQVRSALFDPPNYYNFTQIGGNEAPAKMIWVDGNIIAEGTEQQPIIFTRNPDLPDSNWGVIYLSVLSREVSRFNYCQISYAFHLLQIRRDFKPQSLLTEGIYSNSTSND